MIVIDILPDIQLQLGPTLALANGVDGRQQEIDEVYMERQISSEQSADLAAAIREEILDEIADLEEYARNGKAPPHCRGYRVRVNGKPIVFHEPKPTGREVLQAAGLAPPENYTLRVKLAGHKPKPVGLDERVDLRHPGIEKFKALPTDQTEG